MSRLFNKCKCDLYETKIGNCQKDIRNINQVINEATNKNINKLQILRNKNNDENYCMFNKILEPNHQFVLNYQNAP